MTKLKLIDLRSLDQDLLKYSNYLSPSERLEFENIKIIPRARQWLGGRIAAKFLLQEELGLSLEQIVIQKDESTKTKGRPFYRNWFLSISHAGEVAGAALSKAPVGFDIEEIEDRPYMEQVAFSDALRESWKNLDTRQRAERSTLKWTELEAITKFLGTGLRIPFSQIRRPKDTKIRQATFTHYQKRMGWTMISKSTEPGHAGESF